MTETEKDLRMSCITRRFAGYHITLYLVPLVIEDETRLHAVKKELYYPAAKHFHTTVTAIERNLRTIVDHAWVCNPAWIREMAMYPLDGNPTVADFLDILATRELRRQEAMQCPPEANPAGIVYR